MKCFFSVLSWAKRSASGSSLRVSLVGEVREALARDDDARALLRRLFVTPANLRPDRLAKTLTVELHRLGSPLQDAAVAHLCQLLTDSETLFPTTNLRLIFRQVGSN